MKVQDTKQEAKNLKQNSSKQSLSLVGHALSQPTSEETCLAGKERQKDYKLRHNHRRVCTAAGTMKKGRAFSPEPSSNYLVMERLLKKRTSSLDTGGCLRQSMRNQPLFRQVGDITSPHVKEEMKTADKSTDVEKGTNYLINDSFHPQCSEGTYQCSIGSCNLNPDADCPSGSSDKLMEDFSHSSDAESISPTLSGKKHISRHKPKVDIHKLEVEAYQLTVRALHASGPLSWEQESLLTNLRLSLHISNEEHLLHLRHLLSAHLI